MRCAWPNTALLGDKLELTGVDLTSWILDYLTNRQQYVRTRDCVLDTVVGSLGAPQGTVLAPFLFTLYTADFSHQSPIAIYKSLFADDSAVVDFIRDGNNRAYRELIKDVVDCCQRDSRHRQPSTQVNILGTDIEVVTFYKYLNNKLDWTNLTAATYKKGQIKLHRLRKLRSYGYLQAIPLALYVFLEGKCSYLLPSADSIC